MEQIELNDLLALIDECEELDLPNGASGAIWKDDLISKVYTYLNKTKSDGNITPNNT